MRYITAAVVGAVMSAGAAQAAVFQYDVTMDLTSVTLDGVFAYGLGQAPEWLDQENCHYYSGDDEELTCELVIWTSQTGGPNLDSVTLLLKAI